MSAPSASDATSAPAGAPRIADDTVMGDGCRIAAGVEIAAGVVLAHNVVIETRVSIGLYSTIAAGAFIGVGAVLRDEAVVGPNAVVEAGVTVGTHAELTAGSVARDDIPAYAIAEGNPARIVGYRSSPSYEAERRLRASSLDAASTPMKLGRATLQALPQVHDLRGGLVFGEIDAHLPFSPVRYFTVFDVPGREVRGEHSHRECHQLLICVTGECTVMVNDGAERAEVVLDRPDTALHIPPVVWAAQYHYSPDAVLLVLCSQVYDADDYIRTYDEFERALQQDD